MPKNAPKPENPYVQDESKIIVKESLSLRWIAVADIPQLLWELNPKLHDIGKTWESIVSSGYADPAKWDANLKNKGGGQGALVYGNGRSEAVHWGWQAFQRGDWSGEIPRGIGVDDAGNWYIQCKFGLDAESEAAAADFAIAHNNITMLGGDFEDIDVWSMYDKEALAEVGKLVQGNRDFNPVAMTGDEVDALLTFLDGGKGTPVAPEAQIDKAEELNKVWGVKSGDLWIIPSKTGKGEHRLLCGDSTKSEDVERLMGDDKSQACFTSPPYAEQRIHQYGGIPADKYVEWWVDIQSNVRNYLAPNGCFFVNIKPHVEDIERSLYVFDLVIAMKRRWQWQFIDEFCWLRAGVPKMVKYRFKNAFEPIYHFAVSKREFVFNPQDVMKYSENVPIAGGEGVGNTNWAAWQGTASDAQGITGNLFGGDRIEAGMAYPSNVLKAFSNNESLGHPAAFAVELAEFFIKCYSNEGQLWYEPFAGSGTVMVACEKNKRLSANIEMQPDYCAVILQRMKGMGLEPVLAE